MTEIEKLYENVGINQVCNTCELSCFKRLCPTKKSCVRVKPSFTAEKQLELIKLLGNIRDYTVEIDKFKGVYYVGCREAGSNDKLWGSSNTFENALAELINETWFCLTEQEQQQIKDILRR